MTTATAPHPFPTDPQAERRAEDALYFRQILHGLIDQGADLASFVHGKATAETDAPAEMTLPEATVSFDRCARTVRRTVVLARHVAEPVPVRAEAGPGRTRALARRRILREVEDAIQREAEGVEVETLEAELRERLDGPELDEEIDDRPVAEIVADICRDLGLGTMLGNHPWKRRMPAEVQALCERAAKPPSGQRGAGQARDDHHSADQIHDDHSQVPAAAAPPETGNRFRTWAGPPPYSREASIELMHTLLEHKLPRIRGP